MGDMSTGALRSGMPSSPSPTRRLLGQGQRRSRGHAPATILDDCARRSIAGSPAAASTPAFNVLDRHVRDGCGEQAALIYDSPVTGAKKTYTYAALLDEVAFSFAGGLSDLGVEQGDRVLIYMPMVPEAVIAMLACARLGPSTRSSSAASPRPNRRRGSRTPSQGHRVGQLRDRADANHRLQAVPRRRDRAQQPQAGAVRHPPTAPVGGRTRRAGHRVAAGHGRGGTGRLRRRGCHRSRSTSSTPPARPADPGHRARQRRPRGRPRLVDGQHL